MSLKDLGDISYFRLNNEINRPVNGKIPLHKDKEALKAFSLKMCCQTPCLLLPLRKKLSI